MKKNRTIFRGLAALLIAAVFALTGCDTGTGGEESSFDTAIVGKWYLYPTQVDDPEATPVFEITSSGRLISDANTNGEIYVTTSGGRINSTVTLNGDTVETGSAAYSVMINRLFLTAPALGDTPNTGLFMPFISAIQLAQQMGGSLGADGYFHKSNISSGNGGDNGSGSYPNGNNNSSGGNNNGFGGNDGGGSVVGCGSLTDGTKCTAQSGCGSKFLCITGQGGDMDCTASCSCN